MGCTTSSLCIVFITCSFHLQSNESHAITCLQPQWNQLLGSLRIYIAILCLQFDSYPRASFVTQYCLRKILRRCNIPNICWEHAPTSQDGIGQHFKDICTFITSATPMLGIHPCMPQLVSLSLSELRMSLYCSFCFTFAIIIESAAFECVTVSCMVQLLARLKLAFWSERT